MYLYIVTDKRKELCLVKSGYVIAAPDLLTALYFNPNKGNENTISWPTNPNEVDAQFLGIAAPDTKAGAICGFY